MTSDMHGTISIVSHGHGAMLGSLLRDLEAQAGIERWLVLITFNIPETIDLADYPGLRIATIENPVPKGFGGNHNAAGLRAEGPLLLIVNPDIRLPDRDTLARIAGDRGDERPALRAPVVINSAGLREDSVRPNLTPLSLLRRAIGRRKEMPPAGQVPADGSGGFFWVAGMFLIVDRQVFTGLGGFDERFFLYCEDYDLCARIVNSGRRITLLPDVTVVHDAQRDSHRSWKHLRWHLASLFKVWTSRAYWKIVRNQ
jgi:N-acetylglucosaminyl-diphospho-decaprenol L-rhamnosyltransferase